MIKINFFSLFKIFLVLLVFSNLQVLLADNQLTVEKPGLLSDYLGQDSSLAQSGIKIDQSITQFYGGVLDGGREEDEHYSGRWDFLTNVDGQKAGLWPGLFLKMRVGANWNPIERFGSGTILAPYFPGVISKTDNESIAITDLSMIQMFSTRFGITAGKMDTVDGDFNSFAHGRGNEQFQNLAFVVNPVPSFVPLSTIGAGAFALYEDGTPLASLSVLDTHNVPTESGFDDLFSNGAVIAAYLEAPLEIAGLKSRHRLGYAISTADRTSLDQDPRYFIENGALETDKNVWAVTYNGELFLVSDANDPKRGWGIFSRAAISDPDKNIFDYFLSAGLGGTGIIPYRSNDRFGIGVFHMELGNVFDLVSERLDNEDGIELFYDAAIYPWLRAAADVQFLNGTLKNTDNAWVASGRLRIIL